MGGGMGGPSGDDLGRPAGPGMPGGIGGDLRNEAREDQIDPDALWSRIRDVAVSMDCICFLVMKDRSLFLVTFDVDRASRGQCIF